MGNTSYDEQFEAGRRAARADRADEQRASLIAAGYSIPTGADPDWVNGFYSTTIGRRDSARSGMGAVVPPLGLSAAFMGGPPVDGRADSQEHQAQNSVGDARDAAFRRAQDSWRTPSESRLRRDAAKAASQVSEGQGRRRDRRETTNIPQTDLSGRALPVPGYAAPRTPGAAVERPARTFSGTNPGSDFSGGLGEVGLGARPGELPAPSDDGPDDSTADAAKAMAARAAAKWMTPKGDAKFRNQERIRRLSGGAR